MRIELVLIVQVPPPDFAEHSLYELVTDPPGRATTPMGPPLAQGHPAGKLELTT